MLLMTERPTTYNYLTSEKLVQSFSLIFNHVVLRIAFLVMYLLNDVFIITRQIKAMSHSHYVQFAHVSRMKFWSYVDIRGKTEKSLGLYVKFSQMYHE